ncbi:hypothetical protein KR009_007705 [Drosophila setifemur]|nr:hypothetical protein KR009_007705 [Drosophila setifemur]
MTDSMKFGPGWLRNMSAEPSGSSSTNNIGSGGQNSSVALHNFGNNSTTASSRNLFPEYRYGREEMLSLFDRNCLLPQILPSFKKLFVDKVQYPLALTPSSEEDNQLSLGSSSRPAWLQRSSGGFGNASRGTGRGGTVDRGRIRGKSMYHPIYQRPGGLYEDGISPISIKAERNWNDRNGTGDSVTVNTPTSGSGSLDWNGTPSSSPRKEFSSHHRNMENWRRTRNEDGSGDGPSASGCIGGPDIAGWRNSGGGNTNFGANSNRWGRSTSWRDEDTSIENSASIQRSISTLGTVGPDRDRPGSSKGSGTASGGIVGGLPVASSVRISIAKNTQLWTGNISSADADDNLPEWAMENPSELGGTFDASGAFHGDTDLQKCKNEKNTSRANNINTDYEVTKSKTKDYTNRFGGNVNNPDAQSNETNSAIPIVQNSNKICASSTDQITNMEVIHGDISDRIKDVVDEVEKLIMDDDNQKSQTRSSHQIASVRSVGPMPSLSDVELNIKANSVDNSSDRQHQKPPMPISTVSTAPGTTHPSPQPLNLPFANQVVMQQHHLHHQQHMSMVPTSHIINSNPSELWFYRDPQANVQGPFSAMEMTEWYRAGYFNENLFVRRFSDNGFRPLGELIKLCHGNMPFTHNHLLPSAMELGNLPVGQIQASLPAALPITHQKPSPPASSLMVADQQMQLQTDDQLKASVTEAADSLSIALKNLTGNSMDTTSHMLSMRFQMLQDQYLQQQEYQILAELSKNECFQRLSVAERESVVRTKVQMLVLPEYLSSLNGLSNLLSVLNPVAGSQLNHAVVEQAKKDQQHLFANTADQQPSMGNLLDANNFILNAQIMHQQAQQQLAAPLPRSGDLVMQSASVSEPNKLDELPRNDLDLLNEYNLRMLLRGQPTVSHNSHSALLNDSTPQGGDFIPKSFMLGAQNLMIPMWLPATKQQPNQQWTGISNSKVNLWDVATLEEEQTQQLRSIVEPMSTAQVIAPSQNRVEDNTKQELDQVREKDKHKNSPTQSILQTIVSDKLQQSENSHPPQHPTMQTNKLLVPVKQQEPSVQVNQMSEEDRRREAAEEKRRQKEDRKRQQLEEEKRRSLQEEEKRCRQAQEEKERQHQIQSQRRKALLGNSETSLVAGSVLAPVNKNVSTKTGDSQISSRLPSTSVAPWSLRSPNSNTAPGLAEIQKAERRERRADQQRHQEQLEKQMRANAAAAAEANDALLKWQAAPASAPVISLAEIQAEEAKRLTNDVLEQQRRRDQEQQQHVAIPSSVMASGMPNIWGSSSKAWSATCAPPSLPITTTGLWDEPNATVFKPNSLHGCSTNCSNVTAAAVLASGNKNNLHSQNKSAIAVAPHRNLRKSQTLPAMHNTGKTSKSVSAQQHQQEKVKVGQIRVSPKVAATSVEDKDRDRKSIGKSHGQLNTTGEIGSKVNEYENEFTNWCIKSLDSMSTKVDVPTFVSFLQDLEAPYEVKDYVRIYLGDGKESLDFAKQFLERRSKFKSLQRAQNAHNDDMCKPAPAITPSANDNTDNKNKQKKIKKNKMTKMDARILGFSVTAAEGRINVGVRDYVDGP